VIGFGGPPAHVTLLRTLCVDRRGWLTATEFEDGIAANQPAAGPGLDPAGDCGWRLRGALGALVGGVCFIAPGLIVILGLAALFLGAHPPRWVLIAEAHPELVCARPRPRPTGPRPCVRRRTR
jgi:chromate transporter